MISICLIRNLLITRAKESVDMAEGEVSQQVQDQINRLQQLRTHLQMIMQQRQQVELRLKEIDDAMEELEKADAKTPIYRSVGAILIKAKGKTDVVSELEANKETLTLRKTTLDKQEDVQRKNSMNYRAKFRMP